MDFDRLAEFVAIANCRSIKKAAQELGISSATLSARMLRFEEYLGTTLFHRNREAVTLTPAGQQLLPSAQEILASYEKIHNDMHAAQEHSYHHLRIAICGTNLPQLIELAEESLN